MHATDADTLKLAATLVSTLVAVCSAGIAVRSARRSRADSFSAVRSQLLATLTENNVRAESIVFRSKLLTLQVLDRFKADKKTPAVGAGLLSELKALHSADEHLKARAMSVDSIRSAQPSEKALHSFRTMLDAELMVSKLLADPVYESVLARASAYAAGDSEA